MTISATWVNGHLVPPGEATIGAADHGLVVGDGVFETLKLTPRGPFAVSRHLARLRRSAEALGIVVPTDETLRAGLAAVTDACGHAEGKLRVTVTSGPGSLGSTPGGGSTTTIIAAEATEPWPATTSVVTVPWRRNEWGALTGLKTTSYAENVRALAVAHAAGASEAIFANTAGNLCEGTGTNIFLVLGDALITPTLASGCLAGITRELVIEIADVDERDVPLEALLGADEAFLTSSTRDVQPIAAVDGEPVGQCPGPTTERVVTALADLQDRDLDP